MMKFFVCYSVLLLTLFNNYVLFAQKESRVSGSQLHLKEPRQQGGFRGCNSMSDELSAWLSSNLVNKLPCDIVTTIHISDLPFTISTPGYYCVADNLTATQGIAISIASNNVDLNLSGHTFDLSSSATTGIQVNNSRNVKIYNGIIQNAASSGIAIHVLGSTKVRLEDITTSNCATGIMIEDSVNMRIKNCLCQSGTSGILCSATTVNSYDYLITKTCTLDNTAAGIQLTCASTNTLSNIKIRDCSILNTTANSSTTNPTYGLQAAYVQGFTFEDSTVNTNTYGISLTNCVDCHLSKSKVLNSAQNGVQASFIGTGAIQATQGLTCQDLIIDYTGNTSMVCSQAQDIKIKDCHLINSPNGALSFAGCSNVLVEHCLLNTAKGSTSAILSIGEDGSLIDAIKIADCTIQNNVAGPALNGISITQAQNVSIERSYISVNPTKGNAIFATGNVSNCLISQCMITNLSANGINFTQAAGPLWNGITVRDCHILGPQNSIVINNAQNSSIRNCEISGASIGVNLINAQNIVINNNIISNCSQYGIYLDSNTYGCGVRDNALCNIHDPEQTAAIAISNQGSPNSIYHNYVYASDTTYQNVNLVVSPAAGIGAHENLQY